MHSLISLKPSNGSSVEILISKGIHRDDMLSLARSEQRLVDVEHSYLAGKKGMSNN